MLATLPGAASLAAQAPGAGAAAKWTPARTAWGHPDLQGKWAMADTGTPMERPKEFGDREFLTDQELAAKIAAGRGNDGSAADDADRRAPKSRTQPEHEKGIRGEEYNRFWARCRTEAARPVEAHISGRRPA